MSDRLPKAYQSFKDNFPDAWEAYDNLGATVHAAGPLDARTREFVKLALAIGVGSEGAVHSHTRKCLAAGATPEEIRHVALLSIPTVGFPRFMAALTWIDDMLER